MKISLFDNTSFQKLLVASCNLKTKDKLVPCSIYQLNSTEDSNYLPNLFENDINWIDGTFFSSIQNKMPSSYFEPSKVYALEKDDDERCLALAKTFEDEDNIELDYIVVNNADRKETRKSGGLRHVGETMIAYIVKYAQSSGKKTVSVPTPLPDVKKFYRKCNFSNNGCIQDVNSDKAQEFIEQNEIHNYSKINLIG